MASDGGLPSVVDIDLEVNEITLVQMHSENPRTILIVKEGVASKPSCTRKSFHEIGWPTFEVSDGCKSLEPPERAEGNNFLPESKSDCLIECFGN